MWWCPKIDKYEEGCEKYFFFIKLPKDLTEAQLIPAQLVKREG